MQTTENKLDQMISILSNCEESKPVEQQVKAQKINNVVLLPRDKAYSELVGNGIHLSKLIKKLTADLSKISGHLKIYGKGKIDYYNKENFDSVKSIKIPSIDEATAMVSVKTVNKVDKESISKCKPHIDKAIYDSIFEEKYTYTLKEEFADKVIFLLKKVLGNELFDNSFTKTTLLTLKNKENLDKFLNDESVDEKLREKIEDSIKLSEVSITY